MLAREAGKIIVYGRPSPTRHAHPDRLQCGTICLVGHVQALGVEVAPKNIQVNLIAQNYVENPVYYPESLREQEGFKKSLRRQVPLGRLATAKEDAEFAPFWHQKIVTSSSGKPFREGGCVKMIPAFAGKDPLTFASRWRGNTLTATLLFFRL